jgi:hypothetical protein
VREGDAPTEAEGMVTTAEVEGREVVVCEGEQRGRGRGRGEDVD